MRVSSYIQTRHTQVNNPKDLPNHTHNFIIIPHQTYLKFYSSMLSWKTRPDIYSKSTEFIAQREPPPDTPDICPKCSSQHQNNLLFTQTQTYASGVPSSPALYILLNHQPHFQTRHTFQIFDLTSYWTKSQANTPDTHPQQDIPNPIFIFYSSPNTPSSQARQPDTPNPIHHSNTRHTPTEITQSHFFKTLQLILTSQTHSNKTQSNIFFSLPFNFIPTLTNSNQHCLYTRHNSAH